MTPDRHIAVDVLVVGAGPTGLLLSNLLGRMGVKTALVERNADTVQEPRAVSIDDESMRALQAVGLDGAVSRITTRGYGSIYKGPRGRVFATVKPTSREYGFEKRNAFQQPELEAVLRNGLKAFDSVSVSFGTELDQFNQDDARVRASVTDTDGRPRTIEAAYMVGCDGGRSQTRKALGISLKGATFEEPWLIVDLLSTKNRCFHTEVFCDPARSCITLPGPNGIRRYEFKLNPGESAEDAVEERFVRKLLADVGPDAEEPFRRVRVYTFHARIAERWREGRVFLAGDAAHLTPPFAGQGMNSGLRDAHNLAWKLNEALHAGGNSALLDSYEQERRPHAWAMIQLALRMGQVMMPTSLLQGAMVRAGFHGLSLLPPAKAYFAQMRYKPKPRFEKGCIWPDGRAPKRTLVGRLICQPEVETVSGDHLRLDDALPDRPVVLVFGEAPDLAVGRAQCDRFRALGTDVFGITPQGTKPVNAHFPILRDRSGLLSEGPYPRYLGHALLLRRDRYIAMAQPVSRLAKLELALAQICPKGAPPERGGAEDKAQVAAIND
ncbi:MAG: bifunctional 3-(3-hydroxy-phenyl)propionate/3-hydroxycinnamic acid hydroxylase [Pseudomonadota bacterium]